ncbi:alternate-type signal peptide domain-containing protein [Cryobacterium sp. Y11]|uniref:alternate-type signal peptide domain-containing protein n=1 Tax=Cryobacterium sp. Y11 TaxID=2045016 RepID=UPI000CE43BD7|nr:alternate-type signal peptide domain-containing protein [Cryobacterium sp. Y11]
MNKLLTGSIAGAAGIALLLGGAGTFALWNSEASIVGGTINAGTLTVAAGDGVWADQNGKIAIADYLIVPGDTLTYKTVLDVKAEGDNIMARLTVGDGKLVADSASDADKMLERILKEDTTVEVLELDEGQESRKPKPGSEPLLLTEDDAKYLVTVTITFPAGDKGPGAKDKGPAIDDDIAKTGQVDLSGIAVTLAQYLELS